MNARITLIVATVLAAVPAAADVTLPPVIGSNMVLQADRPATVWGWAEPGEKVAVTFGPDTVSTTADAEGRWRVVLPARGPCDKAATLTVAGKNTLTLENVLVGQVWIGSGQSNMEIQVVRCLNAKEEIPAATHPKIRLFRTYRPMPLEPLEKLKAPPWVECSPQAIPGYSAALYYFGRELQKRLDQPIGLISTAVSGSRIAPWMPMSAIRAEPKLAALVADYERVRSGKDKKRYQTPSVIYNGSIAPLANLSVAGVLWYQGETNVHNRDTLYAEKFRTLVSAWRGAFGRPKLPFITIQLTPFAGDWYPPGALPEVWADQARCAEIPGVEIVPTTDITPDLKSIHPKDKQTLARRMALCAAATVYRRPEAAWQVPRFASLAVNGRQARVRFTGVADGLRTRDGKPLTHFEIAGPDGVFHPAAATFPPLQECIPADAVIVTSPQVARPTAVRFAWRNDATPNLANTLSLPALPFQTDGR